MLSPKVCPYCHTLASRGCAHLAVAVEGRDFVRRCVELCQGARQWRAVCESRRRRGRVTGEWSPEQEDYTWLETAFCEVFLKRLRWFGSMEYDGARDLATGRLGSGCWFGRRIRGGCGGSCATNLRGKQRNGWLRMRGFMAPRQRAGPGGETRAACTEHGNCGSGRVSPVCSAGGMTKSAAAPASVGVECGGKRHAERDAALAEAHPSRCATGRRHEP